MLFQTEFAVNEKIGDKEKFERFLDHLSKFKKDQGFRGLVSDKKVFIMVKGFGINWHSLRLFANFENKNFVYSMKGSYKRWTGLADVVDVCIEIGIVGFAVAGVVSRMNRQDHWWLYLFVCSPLLLALHWFEHYWARRHMKMIQGQVVEAPRVAGAVRPL